MSQSKSIPLDEFPILIRPGISIGWIGGGIADLAVDWDREQDRAYVERVESITLRTVDITRKDAPYSSERLSEDDQLFKLIEAEILRRDSLGDLDLEFEHGPDPDYMRDEQIGRGLYFGLQKRATA